MAIGSGVRAELGRSSAAAILQGATAGAGAIERGLTQFGAGVGSRLEKRKVRKEKEKDDQEFLKAFSSLTETEGGKEILGTLGLDAETFDPAEFGVAGTKERLRLGAQFQTIKASQAQEERLQAESAARIKASGVTTRKGEREEQKEIAKEDRILSTGQDLEALIRIDEGATDIEQGELDRLTKLRGTIPNVEVFLDAKRAGVPDDQLAAAIDLQFRTGLDPEFALKREQLKSQVSIAGSNAITAQSNAQAAQAKLKAATSPQAKQKAQIELKQAQANLDKTLDQLKKTEKEGIEQVRQTQTKVFSEANNLKNINATIDTIIDKMGTGGRFFDLSETGTFGAIVDAIPFSSSSDATQIRILIKRIKADAAFSSLKDLKAAGGTLGQIAVAELDLLENSAGALNPDLPRDEFIAQLQQFKDLRQTSLNNIIAGARADGVEIPENVTKMISDIESAVPLRDPEGEAPEAAGSGQPRLLSSDDDIAAAQEEANRTGKTIRVRDPKGGFGNIRPAAG